MFTVRFSAQLEPRDSLTVSSGLRMRDRNYSLVLLKLVSLYLSQDYALLPPSSKHLTVKSLQLYSYSIVPRFIQSSTLGRELLISFNPSTGHHFVQSAICSSALGACVVALQIASLYDVLLRTGNESGIGTCRPLRHFSS